MAYISRTLDTDPMDRTIDTVSSHVIGTTTAVTAMKAAVIKAEEEAADLVCDNVNKGFYTLIHSQISQKIAKLKSEVDSHLLRLHQLNKQLLSIKSRMGRDYGMISERYITLFNRINKNLQNRVGSHALTRAGRPCHEQVDHFADIAVYLAVGYVLTHGEHERGGFCIHERIPRQHTAELYELSFLVGNFDPDHAVLVVGMYVYAAGM